MTIVPAAWFMAAALAFPLSSAGAPAGVTFTRDVAPIIFRHCASCHSPGEVAPFSLLTYRDVRPRATAIARAIRSRTMPPWKPEPGYGEELLGARRLSEVEIATIEGWLVGGALEGNPSDLPPAPIRSDEWHLGRPDLVVSLAHPYQLAPDGPDVLRNVVLPIPLATTRYVRGVEFRAGNGTVVHHANMRIDRTGTARRLDEADPEPGFDGSLTAGSFPDGHFLGWTPGQLPPLAPPGMAWRLDPNSDLVVQLHLHPSGRPEAVRPQIAFYFTDTPPTRLPVMLRLGRQNIDIPPGVTDYRVEDSYVLPVDVDVYAVQPHAHYRAREVKGQAILPNGTTKWLIYIKDWDFNWQDLYLYSTRVPLPRGTTIAMQYSYDNSASNKRNPDSPPKRVRWGQQSRDEMGDLWIQVVPRTAADRGRLIADLGPKVLAEDAIGYETLLETQPRNARFHDAVAAIELGLRHPQEALAHETEALRIDPAFQIAHYNMALALVALDRLAEASDHLRRAVALDPTFVAAHANLGAVLRLQQRFDDAVPVLHRALQLDPRHAAARANLGGILAAQGREREAVVQYRLSLEANPNLLESLTALTRVLATTSDAALRAPSEAVQFGERAADLTERHDAGLLDALAAAYASADRFGDAIAAESEAITAAEATHLTIIPQLRSNLDRYRLHQLPR